MAETLDLIYEQLQEAKLNLAESGHAFREGLRSEAKTQEEILKVSDKCNINAKLI